MATFISDEFSKSRMMRRDAIVLLKMSAPLIFLLIVVAWFHEFVVNAILANVAINGLIIMAATYGIVLIYMRLIGAQIDYRVIERFGRQAFQGVYMRQMLEEPWLKGRYVRHYLGHIALTGGTLSSALDQNAIENELRTLNQEYEHKMEMPQFLVGFMIAMGLLGTFIGLLETLTGISGMLDGMGGNGADMDAQFMKLVVELKKPLAGMGIAFSASMFGLVTSLMLAIMMINLRRFIGTVVGAARNVMHDLTELTRGAQGSTGAVTQLTPEEIANMASGGGGGKGKGGADVPSLADGETSLTDLVYQMNDNSLMVANRIDGMVRKMENLMQTVENAMQATQKMTEVLGFGPRIKETGEHMLDELKVLVTGQVEQHKFAQNFIDAANNNARILSDIVGNQRDGQAGATLSVRELSDKLQKIEESSNALGRHLWDIKENFTRMGAFSSVAEAISTGVGHQTLLLETLVKEDRNLQKRLTSIQQDLRERSLPPADQGADQNADQTDIALPPV